MKIVTAHQPAYLPWLGYFHKMALADEFVLLDAVQFEKNSFTNRNKIKVSNGEAWLTIPVEMRGHTDRNVMDMVIEERSDWRKKHWNSFLMNYKKAPYFNQHADFFEHYYQYTTSNLALFISKSTLYLKEQLKINTKYTLLSELNVGSKKQDLILDVCKATNSGMFVFGSQGKDYADVDFFKKHDVMCYFQEYRHPAYGQLWGEFRPYMSVIDCLFNQGSDRTREIIFDKNLTKEDLLKL